MEAEVYAFDVPHAHEMMTSHLKQLALKVEIVSSTADVDEDYDEHDDNNIEEYVWVTNSRTNLLISVL